MHSAAITWILLALTAAPPPMPKQAAEFMAMALGESKTRRATSTAKRVYPKIEVARNRS